MNLLTRYHIDTTINHDKLMQYRGLDRISYDVAAGIATYLWRSLIKEFLHLLIGTVPLSPSLFAIPPWYQVATPPSRSPTTTRRHGVAEAAPRKTIWDNNTHWYDLQTLVHLPFVNLIEMSGCASMILRKNVKMWGKSLTLSEIKRNVTFFTAE